ncbi:hypothetical protein LI90_4263 [Carbonactinospora thermoautotrophica]|uniref:Uncharacterized protein n=1 Tax=Carbonactinospora thermoautotrophica TaxID=1469144 RepID=A0A132N0T0_9ACTN|nr:hypothetical protein [Carbonactinospora thermoautotrophica]KWX03212.1 hypothetical protein LI90_4263 [Carbonactinospora thermoautotrophica]
MDLFTLVVLMWVARLTATDIAYAVRGKTPPRIKLRIARMQAEAVAAGQRPRRYGARDYFVDLWHDAWEDARAAREERRAKKQAAKRAELATVTVEPATSAEPVEAKPPTPDPQRAEGPASQAASPAAPAPAPQRAGEAKPPADPEPPAEPATGPAESKTPALPPAAVADPQTPATGQGPAPETAPADEPLATVTPINSRMVQEDTVSAINGETHTLAAAKQYAAEMTKAAGAAVASIEQSIAHLQAREVTGPVLDRLAEASELAAALQAKFVEVSALLAGQDVVAEAYAAAPHAGNKQFLTQE